MNWIDYIFIILFILAMVNGYKTGFFKQARILGTIVIFILFGGKIGNIIYSSISKTNISIDSNVLIVVSYIITFFLLLAIIYMLSSLINKFIQNMGINIISQILGSATAILKVLLVLSILLNLLAIFDEKEQVINSKTKGESFLYEKVKKVIPVVCPFLDDKLLKEYVPNKYREKIDN